MGYASVYERDLILTTENEKMVSERIIDDTKRERFSVP
jgi:hypothetical protein